MRAPVSSGSGTVGGYFDFTLSFVVFYLSPNDVLLKCSNAAKKLKIVRMHLSATFRMQMRLLYSLTRNPFW